MSELQLKGYQVRALDVLRGYFAACHETGSAKGAFERETERAFGKPGFYQRINEPHLKEIPYVCLRVPTGGGKTLMACKAVSLAIRDFKRAESSIVLWLVPSSTILEQTLAALRNPGHPYYQCLDSSMHNIVVKSIDEALSMPLTDVSGRTCIIVSTIQAFRRDDKNGLRVYKDGNSALAPHFEHVPEKCLPEVEYNEATGTPVLSLKNLLAMHRPAVIVDEAHNARTLLSFSVLDGFHPSCIVEFTATPDTKANPSNVLYSVSARELQAEDMIKMPIEVVGRPSAWRELIQDAINCRNGLEKEAAIEQQMPRHEYIRPILLFQAMKNTDETAIHAERLKEILIQDYRIPEEQIRIATSKKFELDDVDLFARDCPVRYIITQQALREGWDCSFAYVLCSIADSWSPIQVEQFIGRIMRLPHVVKKDSPQLNKAYVFAPASFTAVADSLRDALVQNGFQKFEAARMIQETPQMEHDDLFAGQQYDYDFDNILTTIQLTAPPENLPMFSAQLAAHASYDPQSNTITFKRSMSPENRNELKQYFPQDKQRIDEGYIKSNWLHPERLSRIEMGYELHVPRLCVQETPDLLLPFNDETLLERIDFERRDLMEALLRLNYRSSAGEVTKGVINVGPTGEVTSQAIQLLQEQSYVWDFNAASEWTDADLVSWLDERLDHKDIPAADMTAVLCGVISQMLTAQNIQLQQLVVDKHVLLNSIRNALNSFRNNQRTSAYQSLLLPECETQLRVSPECCFSYGEHYPVNVLYSGPVKFNKHLYSEIGDLNDEEVQCAQKLDLHPLVDIWVRNLEKREQDSFWLQTSTDKFYPDFVCKLTDGRILVVEYKGHHLYSNADSTEKRLIGETWARLSNGHCLFVMTNGMNLDDCLIKLGLGM